MKVYLFPADPHGCGHFRMIWPAMALQAQGHDVEIVSADQRDAKLSAAIDKNTGEVVDVRVPRDADLMVFQRVSHINIAQAIKIIRQKGIAVAVELDDDLTSIHPANPAYGLLHPTGPHPEHSWHNTLDACKSASGVIVSTPALLKRFAPMGNGFVFDNYLPPMYYEAPHFDSTTIGWAGSVHSHPNDLPMMGNSVQRLIREGHPFAVIGNIDGVHKAWGLPTGTPIEATGPTNVFQWPATVAMLGIGAAPLADTKFNAAKSWLKMLEYAALGIPCVGSPRAEYTRLNKLGVGWLAKDPNDWYRKLKKLATDDIARNELALAGRAAAEKLRIEDNAWKLAEIYTDIVKLQRAKPFGVHSRR